MIEARKVAEFTLVHLGSYRDPNYADVVVIMEHGGRLYAGIRSSGEGKPMMLLGKFYRQTAAGMYLSRCIAGRFRYADLDGAVIKKQRQTGTANSMSGHSTWTKIWFKDGKVQEFRV